LMFSIIGHSDLFGASIFGFRASRRSAWFRLRRVGRDGATRSKNPGPPVGDIEKTERAISWGLSRLSAAFGCSSWPGILPRWFLSGAKHGRDAHATQTGYLPGDPTTSSAIFS
jgi:hypothetical protein